MGLAVTTINLVKEYILVEFLRLIGSNIKDVPINGDLTFFDFLATWLFSMFLMLISVLLIYLVKLYIGNPEIVDDVNHNLTVFELRDNALQIFNKDKNSIHIVDMGSLKSAELDMMSRGELEHTSFTFNDFKYHWKIDDDIIEIIVIVQYFIDEFMLHDLVNGKSELKDFYGYIDDGILESLRGLMDLEDEIRPVDIESQVMEYFAKTCKLELRKCKVKVKFNVSKSIKNNLKLEKKDGMKLRNGKLKKNNGSLSD